MKKLFTVLIIAICWMAYLTKTDQKPSNLELITASETTIPNTLQERGYVNPYDKLVIQLGSPGNILFIKKNNSIVKKGDLLVAIDNQRILSKVAHLKRELSSLEINRDHHISKMDYRLKLYEEIIESAERRYKHALKYYEYERDKPHQERLEILQINQKLAELELDNSKSIEALEKRLFDMLHLPNSF